MRQSNGLTYNSTHIGDRAAAGLMDGLVAGLAMALYLIVAGLLAGMAPGTTLGLLDPARQEVPLSGALAHLAVAAVYGVVFGMLLGLVPRSLRAALPGWAWGLVYGGLLALVALGLLLPGAASPLRALPTVHLVLAHLLYGLVLG